MGLPLLPPGAEPTELDDAPQIWGDVVVVLKQWDGTLHRWAGDELDAGNVPCDLVYSTSMPGGFRSCTCTLFRETQTPAPEGLFDSVWILGPGGQVYWEGRLQSMPSSTSDGGRISPAAVGHSAHLEDRHDVRAVWVDRDQSQWGPVTVARRYALSGFNFAVADGSSRWDDTTTGSAGPVLDLRRAKGQAPWSSAAGRPFVATAYNVGVPLAGIEFRVRRPLNLTGWVFQIVAFSDDAATVELGTLPLTGASLVDGQIYGWVPPAGTRTLELSIHYPGAVGGNADTEYGLMLAEVAVYGDLTGVQASRTDSLTYGAAQGPQGVTASSTIADAVRRWAPMLTVDDESIQPTTYLNPHLGQREPSTVASLVELINRSHWWDWAVWEDQRFWYHERFGGQSRTWLVATDDGAVLEMEGDTTDVIWSGVVVSYTDFAGVQHTVGPPGSTAERIDSRLQSDDPNNPAIRHGIPRIGHYPLTEPVDLEGAVFCGQSWMDGQASATRRGSCLVTGTVLDEHGNEHPIDMVRAGDRLQVVDRPDDPDRRIIETTVTHATRTNQLTLDNTAQTLEALLERMRASYVGVI